MIDFATDSSSRRGLSLLVFLALLLALVAARSWNAYPEVFHESGQVRLLGADSWFHVRHAEFSRDHFPGLMRYDAGARYPNHGRQGVSGLFNLAIGGVAVSLSLFSDDPFPVEPVAAWAPVVLAGLAFLMLYLVGIQLGGIAVGLGACLVFLLFPGTSLSRSVLGFADQHVLEYLLALGSIGGLVLCLKREWEQEDLRWSPAFLYAAPFAAFFYSWLGAPVYIPLLAAAVFTGMMAAILFRLDVQRLSKGLLRFFGAVVIYQLVVLAAFPDLVMGVNVRWWILAGVATLALLPGLYFMLMDRIRALDRPWLTVLGTTAIFLGACAAFFLYTTKGHQFLGAMTGVRGNRVAEQGDILWMDLWSRFGVPGVLAALSPLLLFLSPRPPTRKVLRLMVSVFGWALFLLWFRTHDFDYAPPILIALMAAMAADDVIRWLNGLLATRIKSWVRVSAALILLVGFLAPYGLAYTPWQSTLRVRSMVRHRAAWFDAMAWLRENTPATYPTPTTQVTDTSAYVNGYGVMSSWDDGNFVAHVGRRPVVVSRFPGARDGWWLTARSEEASLEPLCTKCRGQERVRYAVVTAELATKLFTAKAIAGGRSPDMQLEGYWNFRGARIPHFTYGPAYGESIVKRLVRDFGRGLDRYRLVYESPQSAVLFTLFRPEATQIVLDWVPTDSEAGQQFLEGILNQTVVPVPGGFLYDLATVPQVMIFEILEASD